MLRRLQQLVGLAVLIIMAGCATTPKTSVALTGDLLVDGPNEIANGPPRDRLLWEYRTAAAAMRQGKFDLAKQYLDDALRSLENRYGPNRDARKARSYFHAEAKKTFLGEPYERSMAYIYRGIIYWRDGELDNARACFRSAELEDSDAENHQYAGDWIIPDYFDGLATLKLGDGNGADAFKRAQANARGIRLPPYNRQANGLFFFEFGPGPTKYATGQYGQELRILTVSSPVRSGRLKVDSFNIPVGAADNLNFQATTRGGRVMDHILGNKAVFKSATDTIGNVALLGGLGTAALSRNETAQLAGLGVAFAGLVSKLVSAATVPAADTRSWDNLPQHLSFAAIPLTPGQHTATVEFLDAYGNIIPNLTKTLILNNATTNRDTVVFVSDRSVSPLAF